MRHHVWTTTTLITRAHNTSLIHITTNPRRNFTPHVARPETKYKWKSRKAAGPLLVRSRPTLVCFTLSCVAVLLCWLASDHRCVTHIGSHQRFGRAHPLPPARLTARYWLLSSVAVLQPVAVQTDAPLCPPTLAGGLLDVIWLLLHEQGRLSAQAAGALRLVCKAANERVMGSVQELCIRRFSPQDHLRLLRRCSRLVSLSAQGLGSSAAAATVVCALSSLRRLCLPGGSGPFGSGLGHLLGGVAALTGLQTL